MENSTLKQIVTAETEIREDRNVEESNALLLVSDDLKHGNLVVEEEKRKAKRLRDFVDNQVGQFEKTVGDSKQRVQELMG
jgi:hypothetical protein